MTSLKENPEKIYNLKEHITDLENLFKEDRDRNDAKVKEIEDKIRNALDVPSEKWMNSGQNLKDVIENLHKRLDIKGNAALSSQMIPDKDVLKNASGGLALEGVYKTKNLGGKQEETSKL